MIHPAQQDVRASPALRRIAALAVLDHGAIETLIAAISKAVSLRPRRELITEGQPIDGLRLIVSGWAARIRTMVDGRRQLLSFLLPGDLIGNCQHQCPLAVSTVTAITQIEVCSLPSSRTSPALAEAYAVSHALDEAYLLANISRLGRMSAQERIYDLLLELNERLSLAGLAAEGSFDLPLTQEMFADALGLTPVHVNRMIQAARSQGEMQWKAGRITIFHPEKLARAVGRSPLRVSGFIASPARN